MSWLEDAITEVEAVTPRDGRFALVLVDKFPQPPELAVVSLHQTWDDARRALLKRQRRMDPSDDMVELVIYPPQKEDSDGRGQKEDA